VVVAAEEVDPILEEEAAVTVPNLAVVDSFDMGNWVLASTDFVEVADTVEVVEAEVDTGEAEVDTGEVVADTGEVVADTAEEVVDTVEVVAVSAIVNPYHNYHKISRLSLKERRIWGMEPFVALFYLIVPSIY
jgi:hypothetical protein